jgi:transposase
MSKYSLETKIRVVKEVLELGISYRDAGKSFHISKSIIQRWVARYERYGVDGLAKKSRTYSGDFKVHVVEYIHENNMSFCEGAIHFEIPGDSTVGIWDRIYREGGPEALRTENIGRESRMVKDENKKPKIEDMSEEDLIAEVRHLRMENEYLKKLNALVQAKEKSAKKTK